MDGTMLALKCITFNELQGKSRVYMCKEKYMVKCKNLSRVLSA